MTILGIALLGVQVVTVLLGLIVYLTNSARLVNKQFLMLSIHLTSWAFCVSRIVESTDPITAGYWIRAAFFITAFFPSSFTLLMSSIRNRELNWPQLYIKHVPYILLGLVAAILTLTPFFMQGVSIPQQTDGGLLSVPEAAYGPGYYLYVIYFIVTCIIAGAVFYRAFKTSAGVEHFELQFILYGFAASFLVGAFFALVLPILLDNNQTSQFGPLGIIALDIIVAFGITTRRILGIATILRRVSAYALLACYLAGLYYAGWFGTSQIAPDGSPLPYLVATLLVVFSMSRARGRFQSFANKLISSNTMDVSSTIKMANTIFHSITTLDAVTEKFAELLMSVLNIQDVSILLREDNQLVPHFSARQDLQMSIDDPICRFIEQTKVPADIETLQRTRKTELCRATINQLKQQDYCIATGIFYKSKLCGLLLLEAQTGGRVYEQSEQSTLQILCNQFAVALENARLYTEMQNSKIRNEIMLDQLVSGVIVANTDRTILLFNKEAQRITGINEAEGKDIEMLPDPLAEALEATLADGSGIRNVEASLLDEHEDAASKYIRLGTTFLVGHDEQPMGALLVFTDTSELKSLEEQVRRSDQLSSVGTLAAGMAHEIKNPLVTIKTFTQLLPQRYGDEDFRQNFSSLVAHEVARIDGIVNELLSFSKPARPHLVPMTIQDTIEQTIKLAHEQMSQKNIALKEEFRAYTTRIMGDHKLLSQTLINLCLNAIEAIEKDGIITVGTSNCTYRFANGDDSRQAQARTCIRIQISDTGKGIDQENLSKIFDPFYTLKPDGTGMGLSVAHGIIKEHHGAIEVESQVGRGTMFSIYLPVLKEDAE